MKKYLLGLSLLSLSINVYAFSIFDFLNPTPNDCKVIHTGVFCQIQITSLIFQQEKGDKVFGMYSGIKTENCFKHVNNWDLIKNKSRNILLLEQSKNNNILPISQDLGHLVIVSITPLDPSIPVTVIQGEIKQCNGGIDYNLSGTAVNNTTIKYLIPEQK